MTSHSARRRNLMGRSSGNIGAKRARGAQDREASFKKQNKTPDYIDAPELVDLAIRSPRSRSRTGATRRTTYVPPPSNERGVGPAPSLCPRGSRSSGASRSECGIPTSRSRRARRVAGSGSRHESRCPVDRRAPPPPPATNPRRARDGRMARAWNGRQFCRSSCNRLRSLRSDR